MLESIRHERSLVFLKPDGVQRGLIGEVIARFERAGLKVVGMKMIKPRLDLLDRHYSGDEVFLQGLGRKTSESFENFGLDVEAKMGTRDLLQIGKQVRAWLIDYVLSGPVVAFVLEGVHAVTVVRKLVGDTLPYRAAPGTIRGDFCTDSPTVANLMKRGVHNLIHASGSVEEAAAEIPLWFKPDELHGYERANGRSMFG